MFLRSCIVIWHHELQLVRAVPIFPLLQMFIQVLTSQFTASAGRAETKDNPQTSTVDKIASDKRRMDDLPQINIFEEWRAPQRRALAYQRPDRS